MNKLKPVHAKFQESTKAMKLEYLDDISAGGKYPQVVTDQLVMLYDFNGFQANEFRKAIQQTIVSQKQSLDLKDLEFIEALNCNLTLRLSDSDIGITTIDKKEFYCDLTISGYENMIFLLEPFCIEETNGYQWLYDINNEIEFLFSPGGQW